MKTLFLGLVLALSACAATVGTTGFVQVPKEAASDCRAMCADIGLPLESVVIMANQVGCVCGKTASATGGGAAAGGMAAVLMQEQSQRH
jgi:hypothetical protein